jgi:TolA-binding protein
MIAGPMRAGLGLAGLLSALLLSGCPASPQTLLDRGDDLERRREFQQAQTAYRDALRRLGDDDAAPARELRTRGLAHLADLCYLDLSDTKCASDSYRKLIENYPEAPETFQARAHFAEMLRDRMARPRDAIAQYKALAAYAGKPGLDDFQYQVAQTYFSLRDYAQARAESRALLDRFDGSSHATQARFLIASCYELEAQRPEAVKSYEDLLSRDPDGELAPKARVALAKLLELQGDKERALQLLSQGIPDPEEAAFVKEERRRLIKQLADQKPLSRDQIFGNGRNNEGEGGGEGGTSSHKGLFVKPDAPPKPKLNPSQTGVDPFRDDNESAD